MNGQQTKYFLNSFIIPEIVYFPDHGRGGKLEWRVSGMNEDMFRELNMFPCSEFKIAERLST